MEIDKWKKRSEATLQCLLGTENQKEAQLRKTLLLLWGVYQWQGAGVSPLIQGKVKMFSLEEPAGLQVITHWQKHSLTPNPPLYLLSFIDISHLNVQLDVQHFTI